MTYKTELARKYFAGVKQAHQEGEQKGEQKGRKEGKKEGKQEGKQEAVLAVLAGRGLRVDAQARQRILSCTDLEQLDLWLHKVAGVGSVHELFEHVPQPAPRKADPQSPSPRARKPRSGH